MNMFENEGVITDSAPNIFYLIVRQGILAIDYKRNNAFLFNY
jgi:hypothetical protein